MSVSKLYGKIVFSGEIELLTGMHIGGSSEFSAIGAVDSVVIKDTVTKLPMIPGSSLKGKMRYLLARVFSDTPLLAKIEDEDLKIKRLFGSSDNGEGRCTSRLQYFDMLMTDDSREMIKNMEPDLYVTEIKFENSIHRATSVATPRQIERVPAGAKFGFKLVYNIENIDEIEEDIENVKLAMDLLEEDYLGGHGTRGYGRMAFKSIINEVKNYSGLNEIAPEEAVKKYFNE